MKTWRGVVVGAVVCAVVLVADGGVFDVLAKGGGRGGGGHKGGKGGDTSVRGHTKRDGTYVQPHHRKAPNSSKQDNYSTKGNVNPYTGKEGTVEPFR